MLNVKSPVFKTELKSGLKEAQENKIVITDFRINNIPIDEDPTYSNDISVIGLEKISIPYNAAVISVNFSAIEFSIDSIICLYLGRLLRRSILINFILQRLNWWLIYKNW